MATDEFGGIEAEDPQQTTDEFGGVEYQTPQYSPPTPENVPLKYQERTGTGETMTRAEAEKLAKYRAIYRESQVPEDVLAARGENEARMPLNEESWRSHLPLHGYNEAQDQGFKTGMDLGEATLGKNIAGKTLGGAVGLPFALARGILTTLNPIGKITPDIAQLVQAVGERQGALAQAKTMDEFHKLDTSGETLTGERPVEANVKFGNANTGSQSLDTVLNVGSELADMAQKDPVGAGLLLTSVKPTFEQWKGQQALREVKKVNQAKAEAAKLAPRVYGDTGGIDRLQKMVANTDAEILRANPDIGVKTDMPESVEYHQALLNTEEAIAAEKAALADTGAVGGTTPNEVFNFGKNLDNPEMVRKNVRADLKRDIPDLDVSFDPAEVETMIDKIITSYKKPLTFKELHASGKTINRTTSKTFNPLDPRSGKPPTELEGKVNEVIRDRVSKKISEKLNDFDPVRGGALNKKHSDIITLRKMYEKKMGPTATRAKAYLEQAGIKGETELGALRSIAAAIHGNPVWATAEGLLALKNLKKSFGKDINSLNSLVKQRIDLLKGRAAPIKQPTIQEWMQTPEGAAKLSQRLAENKAADLAELQKQQRSQSKQAKYQMEVERRKNQLADLEAKRAADQAKIELESMRQGPPTPPPFYQSVLPD
jgi:hypothetical protein